MNEIDQPERRISGRRRTDTELELRVNALENEMHLLRKTSESTVEKMDQLLDIVTMGEGFFKALKWIGILIKWAVGVGAALVGAYVAWRAR